MEHLFFSCSKVTARWREVRSLLQGSQALSFSSQTLYEAITNDIQTHKTKPGPLILLMDMCSSIWKERNEGLASYSHFLGQLPGLVGLRKTEMHLKAMHDLCYSQGYL